MRFPRLPNPFAKTARPAEVVSPPVGGLIGTLKAAPNAASLSSVIGWWPRVWESFTGAWQQNVVVDQQQVAANWAVFSCVTLIAGDIGKMPARVMQYDNVAQIFVPTLNRPVLRKPNGFQTWPDFIHSWIFSLLLRGNAYVLKERDAKGFVIGLYVLDPNRVVPLVANDGSVYYQIGADYLSAVTEPLGAAPADDVIHDRINTLYHPLVGLSPIFAAGVSAMNALAIQNNSSLFFQNMSRPSGMLTAPGAIADETAARLKETFQSNFGGANIGKLFVAGDGLKYEAMTVSAEDSQLIDQLKMSGEMICATFHVPPYKLGLGAMPTVNNTAQLNQQYYDQCLHPIVDSIERRLDDGLELTFPFEIWFDTSELLRMDPATRVEAQAKGIASGALAPNEARREENRPPMPGGEKPFMQQQYWPIDKLASRDVSQLASPAPPAPGDTSTPPQPTKTADDELDDETVVALVGNIRSQIAAVGGAFG